MNVKVTPLREILKEEKEKKKEVAKRKKKIKRFLKEKSVSKRILRSQRAVVEIKEHKPEPYKNIYFKEQYLKERKNLFLR